MRFIYTLLQRVYSIEKIEPSVTVVLEWKSLELATQILKNDTKWMNEN
jgi:hypothetical protein